MNKLSLPLIQLAAFVAFAANAAFNEATDNPTPLKWEETTEEIRQGYIHGVEVALANNFDPIKQHESWMKSKLDNGWKLDKWMSIEKKTHPNLVPFSELSVQEQTKDVLFCLTVAAILQGPDIAFGLHPEAEMAESLHKFSDAVAERAEQEFQAKVNKLIELGFEDDGITLQKGEFAFDKSYLKNMTDEEFAIEIDALMPKDISPDSPLLTTEEMFPEEQIGNVIEETEEPVLHNQAGEVITGEDEVPGSAYVDLSSALVDETKETIDIGPDDPTSVKG